MDSDDVKDWTKKTVAECTSVGGRQTRFERIGVNVIGDE